MITKYAAAALLLATIPAVSGAAPPSHHAPAAATTHTKRLLLHVTATKDLDQLHFAGTERVRSRTTGAFVGFDSFRGHVLSDRVVFETALACKGGLPADAGPHGRRCSADLCGPGRRRHGRVRRSDRHRDREGRGER
ncbi:hypothetical protein FB382_001031 [Nocardioides ginsengisegetis]|uniref:Uncharacterized protein n=1 Tax=Nocardioides ginsengisegetis TaxID=661491 RepID=A0A7W3P8M4_9ACTN|nr:hypothetical protein [Nocardioides ginsengisegetis]MBA8802740.1 hypothetical protein [Nocardioides ginsengisegetis]